MVICSDCNYVIILKLGETKLFNFIDCESTKSFMFLRYILAVNAVTKLISSY